MSKVPKYINRTAEAAFRTPKKLEKYFSTQSMAIDALNTLGNEIQKIRVKSFHAEEPLKDTEVKILTDIVKVLIQHEKHEFELSKSKELTDKLEAMTDGELLDYAKQLVNEEREVEARKSTAKPSSNPPNTAQKGIEQQIAAELKSEDET